MEHHGDSGGPVDEPSVSGPVDGPAGRELGGTARALMRAFVSISSDLGTRSVLTRIVTAASELTGARYGVLAVLGHDETPIELVFHGFTEEQAGTVRCLAAGKELLDPAQLGEGVIRIDDLASIAGLPGVDRFLGEGKPRRSLLLAPIRQRGMVFGRLFLIDKQGCDPFDDHDAMLVESFATVAGFVLENAHAYSLSERRRQWLERFSQLSDLLTPPISLQSALERIAETLLEVSGARAATVVQVAENGRAFSSAVCGQPLEQLSEEESRMLGDAVREVVGTARVKEVVIREDWVTVLAPLRAHLTMPGVLILLHPRLGRADALAEQELLVSFADQAALAMDRTQALTDREQMAVVSDRDRIARDLHDVVIQRLFAIALHMQSIRSAAPTDELRTRIDQSVRDLDQTIRDIRSTIFELQTRPRHSVRTEVQDVVRDLIPQIGFAPSVQTTGPVDTSVDPQVQQQLVAVLREALTNVARHAQAANVEVHLQLTPTHLRLKVADDGVGMPEERTELGLRNARRRAALLGGNLDLWPNDPSGTIFVWSVPLPQDESASAGTD